MKKWLKVVVSVLFAVCLCLAFAACEVHTIGPDNNSNSGSTSNSGSGSSSNSGSNQQKTDSDGTFIYSGATVKAANTSISGDIVIPTSHNGTTIDTIPANAFKGCNAITSITVPEGITSIGEGAFSGCSLLRSITLPFVGSQKGNTGDASFFGYVFGKKSYQGATSVQHEPGSFKDNYYIPTSLRNVTITNETILGNYSFRNCSMLTTINLNDKITQAGKNCFEYCSKVEEIDLPNVAIISPYLCCGCLSLSKFTLSNALDSIGECAFYGCNALSSFNSEIEGTYIIPDTVMTIGDSAFNGCSSIKNITLPFVGYQKGNSGTASFFGYIFGTDSYEGATKVAHKPATYLPTNYYIPSGLKTVTITHETVIGEYAFRNCSMITTLTINSGAKNNVGEHSFEGTVKPTWN